MQQILKTICLLLGVCVQVCVQAREQNAVGGAGVLQLGRSARQRQRVRQGQQVCARVCASSVPRGATETDGKKVQRKLMERRTRAWVYLCARMPLYMHTCFARM